MDTNCLFDYFVRDSEYIEKLIELQKDDKVELAIITRTKADTFGKDPNSSIWRKIKDFPCKIISTLGSWDVSYWDEDQFADENDEKLQKKIQTCIGRSQKKLNDVDILIGHIKHKRDIFVTNDGHFIKHRNCLSQQCKVKIMTPQECVEYIENQ